LPASGDDSIARFDVEMDDAFCVDRIQRVGNLNGSVEQFVGLEGAAGDALPEGFAFEQFYGDEGVALELVDVNLLSRGLNDGK
jgi:hypothetical protein